VQQQTISQPGNMHIYFLCISIGQCGNKINKFTWKVKWWCNKSIAPAKSSINQ